MGPRLLIRLLNAFPLGKAFESVKILLWSILTETSPLTRWTCSLLSSISILLMIPCGGLVLLIGYILFKKNKL